MANPKSTAIAVMNGDVAGSPPHRYDVVIVCCTDDEQARYWGERLSSGLCSGSSTTSSCRSSSGQSPFPLVLAVSEDWGAGGAGNGLGTLYAFRKAAELASSRHGVDLMAMLSEGAVSAALFHTAGKGTRLAPLPASENNNKPAVKLPATTKVSGRSVPMTVLEAVIKQTSIYAPSRKGRLSVFWGDQVFIPSASTAYTPNFHVDILCTLGNMVGEDEWKERGLEKYGVIAVAKDGKAAQVEKVDHPTAVEVSMGRLEGSNFFVLCILICIICLHTCVRPLRMCTFVRASCHSAINVCDALVLKLLVLPLTHAYFLPPVVAPTVFSQMLKSLGDVAKVGPSLGSFSISAAMLAALSEEFEEELKGKTGKLDTDPHFWMPMTLGESDYLKLMTQKGVAPELSTSHFHRMDAFKCAFIKSNEATGMGLFGAVDVGSEACWWDYGQLRLYLRNNLKMLEESEDAALLRSFMGVKSRILDSNCGGVTVDSASCVLSSNLATGTVAGSVVSCVSANSINVDGAILVNVSAKRVRAGKGAILYNIVDSSEEGIEVGEGDVLVGLFDASGGVVNIRSNTNIDGGKAWKEAVCGNPQSFEDIHAANKNAKVAVIEDERNALHEAIKAGLSEVL